MGPTSNRPPGPPRPTQRPAAPGKPDLYKVDWSGQETTQKLVSRGEQSYRTKDGDSYKGILDENKTRDLKIGKITMSEHYWSVIPYLAGSQDPEVVAGRMKEGDPTYTVGVYTHRNIGPNQSKIICLAKTYGRPCPVCEHRDELNRIPDGPDEKENEQRQLLIRALLPSKFQTYVYYIWDRDHEQKGVQIYEISGFFFEKELQQQAKSARGGGYIPFMSPLAGPNGGRDIAFKVSGEVAKQQWSGVKFEQRDTPIPQQILAQANVPLDELLLVMDYQELHDLFWAGWSEPTGTSVGEQTAEPTYGEPECFGTGYAGGYVECKDCSLYEQCIQYNPVDEGMTVSEANQVSETPAPESPAPAPESPAPAPESPVPTAAPVPGQRTTGPAGPPPRRPTPLRRG